MLVTTEEEMQSIISSRSDLEWDGWSVVKYTKKNNAMHDPNGCFKNGVWMHKTVFPLTEDGWNIPNTIGRTYAKMEG